MSSVMVNPPYVTCQAVVPMFSWPWTKRCNAMYAPSAERCPSCGATNVLRK